MVAELLLKIKEVGSESLDKVTAGLSAIRDKLAVVATAATGMAVAAIAAFRESEAASNALNQSMVQQGVFTKALREEYDKMATAIQQTTTFSDDSVTASQAVLQSYLGQTKITKELMQATVDLAAAKGIDLSQAAEMVGKSIGTETNALARQGIELTDNASKSERLAQVTDQLTQRYGGQAEAQAQGLGTLVQLKNALEDVLEVVGERLAPYISFFTKQLYQFSAALKDNSDFASGLESTIKFLSGGFVFLKNSILGTVEVISTGLAAAIESVALLTQGQFARAKEVAAMGMDEIGRITVERKNNLMNELEMLDQQKELTDQARQQRETEQLALSEANKTDVIAKETKKRQEIEKKKQQDDFKVMQERLQVENAWGKARADIVSASANLITEVMGRESKAAFLAQKAAALAQAYVAMNLAAAQALAVPPAPNFALAELARTAGYINIAAIAASTVKGLATGGIVSAKHGGTPFILGEGGKDEAVIPLDDPRAQERLGGGGTTINFNGPILGNESQAADFARAIDKQLLKLRQTGQSVAFETDIF